ncbi:MAG: RNA-splicing ligase RtcB [Candidatus Eisenbacteria bacterium]|nr:RNA-splicing ligase RtcB [Candidatus Eisenbacteria bacterium]
MSNAADIDVQRITDTLWEIPRTGGMRVPGRVFLDEPMLARARREGGLRQVVHVAHLPGIVGYSLAMPDIHWGYGFPIGGVAATDPTQGGVISPGGVGYDINCGVRLMTTALEAKEVRSRLEAMVTALFRDIPTGVGSHGAIERLSDRALEKVMTRGARWAVEEGYGDAADLPRTEEEGCLAGADPAAVSPRARSRGREQLGTLGSGNHFAEIDQVDEIYHPEAAAEFGLREGQITLQIHTGSRGFGHQVCDDYLKVMGRAVRKYDLELPDRQLACTPLDSPEGRDYLAAMACAANYAWANRQTLMALAERALLESLRIAPRDLGMRLLYDVCHNIAKLEQHEVGGAPRRLCVHRKGATRAYPPKDARNPWRLGQPVLVPGDMGTVSFVCLGQEGSLEKSFGSTCHGAGRVMSRREASRRFRGQDLVAEMRGRGVLVMAKARGTIAEEMSEAYKDVSEVVEVTHRAGLSLKVARLRPLAVIKG